MDIIYYNEESLKKLSEKYVGKTFGNLFIEQILYKTKSGKRCIVKIKCYCGKEFKSSIYDVIRGHTKSCGCFKGALLKALPKNKKHGESVESPVRKRSSEYNSWINMRYGALSKSPLNLKSRPNFIKNNIEICERWLDKKNGYINFLEDMGRKPLKISKLKRIDGKKGFFKENCYWYPC